MANISQPFWDMAQNCNEVPQGQVFIRHTPIFDSEAEPAIIYEGKEQSEWVKRYPHRMAIAKLHTNRWFEDGLTDAICLKPEGEVRDLKTFETLGSKIINHHPGWRGKEPIQNSLIDLPYYAEWAKYIVKNYSKELSEAELVGGIVASVGRYEFDLNFYKALLELWCPSTNTFHFLHGEVGISLWDIKELGGLSITGDVYDEVVPPNDTICRRYDPEFSILRNLFDIFQWLSRRSASQYVFFEDWVEFFREPILSSRYEMASNPPPKPVFKADLVAFIALWICFFIMPGDREVIRPGVFMMACNIAHGRRVAFAPAVLARLYLGLNAMANQRKGPGFSTTVFPAHFLYAWAGYYFRSIYLMRNIDNKTSSIPGLLQIPKMLQLMNSTATPFVNPVNVRKFIRHEDNFVSRPFPFMHHNNKIVRDSKYPVGPEVLDSYTMEYVMNLRCGVLPLRCAGDFFAEPYNPHRFGRQFGYDQHAPAYIDVPRRAPSLGTLAGYWLHLSRQKTSSSFYIPEHDRNGRLILVYAQKWLRTVEAFFQQSFSSLIQDDFKDRRVIKRERGQSSKGYRFINESVFIDYTDHTVDSVNLAKRQRTEDIQIHDTPLDNVRVIPSPPRIDDAPPSDLEMHIDSHVDQVNPQSLNVGPEENVGVGDNVGIGENIGVDVHIEIEEAFSKPPQGDIPVAIENEPPQNPPIIQEVVQEDESTSSFNQIPSANFIRDAPSSMEKSESDGRNIDVGGNVDIVNASPTGQNEDVQEISKDVNTPTEELESGGSNADVGIGSLPKQDQGLHEL